MITRSKYQPAEIESRWISRWAQDDIYAAPDESPLPKYYNLAMLPYPSGDLHIGHWYNYTGADIYGRYQRMRGHNVMQPIGFDAFGLPAENAAIKRNIQPRTWTLDNIANMRRQLARMGAGWDWSREIVSCLPDYYKWTQWLFLQFYKHGQAYRTKAPANWCPTCNTTLANEQVINGVCERCGTPVERREIDQWLLRITDYADQLLNFDGLDWPEKTRLMQTNWIGRSEGAELRFTAHLADGETVEIPVFTTRPDTIYGVTFFVLAPEHPLVERLTAPERRDAVQAYIEQTRHETEIERLSTDTSKKKTGVPLGATITNPISGEEVPVWIADYVLMGYGTGAVMGVPAHDQRDFEFARAFGLPIREVIRAGSARSASPGETMSDERSGNPETDTATWEAATTVKGAGEMVNSGPFTGTPGTEAIRRVIAWAEAHGVGKATVTYRLRDWLISRQRFWGAPIPIVYCPEHGAVPVPEDQLPVVLPDEVEFKPTGESPLRYVPAFFNTTCPICGEPATREVDTMDTFICSSWYFLRYADPQNATAAFSPEQMARWLPVDMYIGGAEHATMHLLYARYFVKVLRDIGLLAFDEPFTRLYHQGIVLGPDGVKMSKSRGNVIAPDDVVGRYGADAVRSYLMFMGPFDQGGPWNNQGIEGVWRFMNRVWALASDYTDARADTGRPLAAENDLTGATIPAGDAVERLRHKIIARVGDDYAGLRFNTALAALMEFVNGLNKARDETPGVLTDPRFGDAIQSLLVLLAPIAPFITEELWHALGHDDSVHIQAWPAYDPAMTVDEIITVVVQVNGKVRDKLEVAPDIAAGEVRSLALASPRVQAALAGRDVKKFIYVEARHLANIVG
ncbi:MAG TPA: leucine--tRNA ligase [Ktedonobacterales bacterium]|nr:leucine--tRNA ligase [Ktedonobacterales bacterium]